MDYDPKYYYANLQEFSKWMIAYSKLFIYSSYVAILFKL